MNDFMSATALLYSIPLRQIVTLKTKKVFALITPKESYILKKTDFSPEENQFLIAALLHLKNRGFHCFNELLPNRYGSYISKIGTSNYFLAKGLFGRNPEFKNAPDTKSIGAYLGNFHRATEGFLPTPIWDSRNKWGKLLDTEKQADIMLQDLKQKIQDQTVIDEFDDLFSTSVDAFRRQIQISLQTAEPIYTELWQQQYVKGGFIHHDPAYHNFIINADNQVSAIDFDYAVADFALHDVASLLLKILKRNHWHTDQAAAALAAYRQLRPLSNRELALIKAMLIFPYDYQHAVFAHYRENNHSHHIHRKLLRSVTELPERQLALARFYQWTEGNKCSC